MNAKSKCYWRLHQFVHHTLVQPNCRSQRSNLLHQSATFLSSAKYESGSQPHITIPNRVPRGPTTILRALADTVDYDPTDVGQHALIDDPGTLSHSRRHKMNYLLAEDSGKKAAQQAIETWPNLLQRGLPEPPIEAFTPPLVEKADTEECLNLYISQGKVTEAQEIYSNMSATGTEVSAQTKLLLFDLMCRLNSKDADYYESPVEKYFDQPKTDRWKPSTLLDELYIELCDEHPQAHISIICGMCKYYSHKKAYEVYSEAIEAGVLFPIEVHNKILTGLVSVFVNINDIMAEVQKILAYLENHGIRPNLETFNNILVELRKLPAFTKRYNVGLRIVKEMKMCGIEPSAATYLHLLDMVYKSKHTKQPDVLRYLVDKFVSRRQTQLRDPRDIKFLRSAMNASLVSNDMETAHKLYKFAWKGSNKAFLGDSHDSLHFHEDYLMSLISSEPIEEIMKAYSDIVPRCFVPNSRTYNSLLDAIELYGSYHYLPQIFEDMKFGGFMPYLDHEKFTKMLTVEHQTPQLYQQFSKIADDMLALSERSTSPRVRTLMKGSVFSNFIKLSLNMGDLERAWYWFETYMDKEHSKEGMRSSAVLLQLAKALMKQGDLQRVETVLQTLMDLGFKQKVEQLISKNGDYLAPLQGNL